MPKNKKAPTYQIDGTLWMSVAMLVVIWLELGANELHVSEFQLIAVTAVIFCYNTKS